MSVPRSVIEASPTTLLYWAQSREEAGDIIGSGVCLKAAIHRHLLAMARDSDCMPTLRDHRRRPKALLSALYLAKVIGEADARWIREAIDTCKKAVRAGDVDRDSLRGGILMTGILLGLPTTEVPTRAAVEGGDA